MRGIDKAKKRFVQEKKRYERGWGEINFFRHFIQVFLIVQIWLISKEIFLAWWVYALALILYLGSAWVVGYIWDKANMFSFEREFDNERNWFVTEIRQLREDIKKGKI